MRCSAYDSYYSSEKLYYHAAYEGRRHNNGRLISVLYSAFNLEEPLLCFVVNKYVLYSEKVTIVAIGLKFAMSVHTSFRSVCRKSGLIMLVDSKVVAACVPGIGLQL